MSIDTDAIRFKYLYNSAQPSRFPSHTLPTYPNTFILKENAKVNSTKRHSYTKISPTSLTKFSPSLQKGDQSLEHKIKELNELLDEWATKRDNLIKPIEFIDKILEGFFESLKKHLYKVENIGESLENKSIANGAKSLDIYSKPFKALFKIGANIYILAICSLPHGLNFLGIAYHLELKLKKFKQEYGSLLQDPKMAEIQQRFLELQRDLAHKKQAAKEELKNALYSFTKWGTCYPFPQFITSYFYPQYDKTVLGKCFKGLFGLWERGEDLLEIKRNLSIYDEWGRHLEPDIQMSSLEDAKENIEVKKRAHLFFEKLKNCQNLAQVKVLVKAHHLSIEIPYTWEDWKRLLEDQIFQDYIFRHYYYRNQQTPVTTQEDIDQLIIERKRAFENYMTKAEPIIESLIQSCAGKNFENILEELKKYHLYLNRLENSPRSKEEWLVQAVDQNFKRSLCHQWAEYQETQTVITEKAYRASQLRKISQEKRFLTFYRYQNIAGIALEIIQMAVCFPSIKAHTIGKFLYESLINPISGISIIQIFYPKKLSKGSLILYLIEYIYFYLERPYAYSWEACRISLLKVFLELSFYIRNLLNFFQRLGIILNIQIIEQRIRRLPERQVNQDPHYIELTCKMEQIKLEREKLLVQLNTKLKKLQLKDVRLLLNPKTPKFLDDFKVLSHLSNLLGRNNLLALEERQHLEQALKSVKVNCLDLIHKLADRARDHHLINEAEYEQAISLAEASNHKRQHLKKFADFDALTHLIEAFDDIDSEGLPDSFVIFFKKNFGIDIRKCPKNQLRQILENYFIQDGEILAQLYQNLDGKKWDKLYQQSHRISNTFHSY